MTTLSVSTGGLPLVGAPDSYSEDGTSTLKKPPQALQLDLEEGVLQNILRSARSGGKGVHISFGKTITLNFGNRSKQLAATSQSTPTELYNYDSEKPDELHFVALQSHRLALKKAQDNTFGADAALAKLQSSLATHEAEKQARQIQCADETMPPKAKAATSAKSLAKGKNVQPTNPRDDAKPINPFVRPSSKSPAHVVDNKMGRSKAIRIPLVHILAVRPVSQKYLMEQLNCDPEEGEAELQKVGREYRLDFTKWELTERAYRELDVFGFPYKNADDRQLAITRAITAYDRMRLPSTDSLWQKLLPVHERGRGKVLSKLQMKERPGATTPRINVQHTGNSATGGLATSNDSDRLAPSDAEAGKKSKASTSKGKGAASKDMIKKGQKVQKPNETSSPKSAAKKGVKKNAPAKIEPKSSEFVRDSDEDEDEDMTGAPTVASSSKTAQAAAPRSDKPGFSSTTANAPVLGKSSTYNQSAGKRPPTAASSSSESNPQNLEKNLSSGAHSKNVSRPRNTSSPHKPSPLGSSPPANASDLDEEDHASSPGSSGSTPLVASTRQTIEGPQSKSASKSVPNTADNSLKRKANDIDSNIHDHNAPSSKRVNTGGPSAAQPTEAAPISPPTSDSQYSSSSDAKLKQALNDAAEFKKYYARYYSLYQEVKPLPKDVPNPRFDRLMRMHEKLEKMKADIVSGYKDLPDGGLDAYA